MTLDKLDDEQWARLGYMAHMVVAARRQAEAKRLLLLEGVVRVLEREKAR